MRVPLSSVEVRLVAQQSPGELLCAGATERGASQSRWHYLNLFSLDAPLVAVAWQAMLGASFELDWAWPHALVLGLSVWLVYVGDRLLDAVRIDPRRPHARRHRFHLQYQRPLLVAATAILCFDLCLAVAHLDARQLGLGCLIVCLVASYIAGVHLPRKTRQRRREVCFKELQVGLIFALGVSLSAWSQAASLALLCATGFSAVLFTVNCLFIADWEREIDEAQHVSSMSRSLPWLKPLAPWLVAAVSLAAAGLALVGHLAWPLAWTFTASGASLLVVRYFLSTQPLRGLFADAALLAPAVVCLLFLL